MAPRIVEMEVRNTGKVPKSAPREGGGVLGEESLMDAVPSSTLMNPNGRRVVYAAERCNRIPPGMARARIYFILNKPLHPVA
jgi:hypothetical protein